MTQRSKKSMGIGLYIEIRHCTAGWCATGNVMRKDTLVSFRSKGENHSFSHRTSGAHVPMLPNGNRAWTLL